MEVMKSRLSEHHIKFIHPRFEEYQDTRVLAIECWPSDDAIYLKHNGGEHFFVRAGDTTKELSTNQLQDYINQRFQT